MTSRHLAILTAALVGCAAPGDDTAQEVAALDGTVTQLVQPGSGLVVYGVTEDGFAIYQDGGTIFATRLHAGAARRAVTDVGSVQPIVLVSGRVALVFTEQFYFGAGGASPLVVWSAEGGARLATPTSVGSFVGTRGVAVRPDSGEILFIANVSPDGTTGDVVSAAPDLSRRRTLVAGIDVDFTGACPPLVGFDTQAGARDDDRDAHAMVAACPAGASTATLSRFAGGGRVDLASDLATPPTWSSDAAGVRFFTIAGTARTPITVDRYGRRTVLEDAATTAGFIDFDGSVITSAATPSGRELHRFRGSSRTVLASLGAAGFFESGHHAEGFRHYTDFPASRDGRLMLYGTQRDPAIGSSDLFLLDVTRDRPASLQLQGQPVAGQAFELFTRDSTHALYYVIDPTTFDATLFAASLAGDNRPVSSGAATEFEHFALTGSQVVYSDNLHGTGVDLLDDNDIVFADVGRQMISPRVLAPQAHNLFFPTPDRTAIVYTSDHDPAATGLFIVRLN